MADKKNVLTPEAVGAEIKSDPSGVYVFFGDEDYLKDIYLERIKKAVMTAEGFDVFNYFAVSLSDERAGCEKLADALFASPVMQEKTLVTVRDLSLASGKSAVLDAICEMLAKKSDDCVVVLIFRSDELVSDYNLERSSAYKKLSSAGKLVKFDLLSDAKLFAWIKTLLAESKITISGEAAAVLTDMCSRRMLAVSAECAKLSAYCRVNPEIGEITPALVRQICTQNAKDEVPFEMSNAAAKWNLREMLTAFSSCRDRREEPITVTASLGKIYTDMLKMKTALLAGHTSSSAAKALGMNEYRARLVADSVQRVPLEVIESAVLLTYRTDVALKSTVTDKWVLLDELAAQIYTPKSLRTENA